MSFQKKSMRFASMLLSLCLTYEAFGVTVTDASPAQSSSNHAVAQLKRGDIPSKLPKTKLELPSKRTKYSTTFLNPDGSFTAVVYNQPEYYIDPSDQQWKTIDNTLHASTSNTNTYENTANDFKTSFAKQTGTGNLASVSKNGESVSFVPVNVQNATASVKGNQISYANLFQDVVANYQVNGDSLKEDLVLNKFDGQNTFSYELNLKGLKAVQEKDGTISFVDGKGQKQFYFAKPFMKDAKGKVSDNVHFTLREQNGKTFVDVTADQAFLSDAKTAFPVDIDPTVNSWDVQQDNWVASNFPTSIYTSGATMDVGNNSYYGSTRSYVQFFLPTLPSSSTITSANFNAYQTNTDTSNVSIDLDRVKSSWSTNMTWNTQPSTNTAAESAATSSASNAYWQWDTTQLVKDWYSGAQANYGFMLKAQNETTVPSQSFNTVHASGNTPRLTINYTVDPIGSQDYWSLTKDGVNPANGNLLVQAQNLNVPGRGVPAMISRTFNSRAASTAGMFGYGWSSNLEQRLIDPGTGPITFIDASGTHHIFGQNVSGGYTSPTGLFMTLVKNSDSTYTMTQSDGSKVTYNTSGQLSRMADTNGNTTTLTYNANGKVSTITDASGRQSTIAYGTNGYVSSITDPANHKTTYTYDANGNLITATNAASKSLNYAYDSMHHLTGLTNPNQVTTTYVYDSSNRISTVSQPITINGTKQTSTTTYTYDTTNLVTTVLDGEGHRVDYTYNSNGNVVQTTVDPTDATNKSVTTYTYDNDNNMTSKTDPNTNSVSGNTSYVYTYDANGNIVTKQLPGGQTTSDTYDDSNNLVSETDPNNNTTSFNYDASNNNTASTDPNIQTAATRYASNGNMLYTTNQMSTADNLIANSSFETATASTTWPDGWTQSTQAGTTATFGWSSTSNFGNKAVSISNPTGWAVVTSAMIPFTPGTNYVLSGYVKTASTTSNALVKVSFYDASGNWLDQTVAYQVPGTQDWTRLAALINNAPANTAKIAVAVGLNAGSGTAYFDGIQLEKSNVISAYNLVDNSSFERNTAAGTMPDSWKGSSTLTSGDGVDTTTDYVGNSSFKINGQSGVNKYVTQHINVSGDATTPLTLSGWSKQSGANPNGGAYELQVAINYTDGTVDWTNANDFSAAASDWQQVAAAVKPTKPFNSIDVYYYYYNQTGTAWFDAMRLEYYNQITTNSYDANGNYITGATDQLGNTTTSTYDAIGNETSKTDGNGNKTSYNFDASNLLTQVTDANQGVTSYGYDNMGNLTKVTDARNNVTTYAFNEFNSIASVTNPLNQTIQYSHDKDGNITSQTFPKGDKVSFTYNGLNRLTSVAYNGVTQWTLGYDPNGNQTSVTDASGAKTSYTFDANNQLAQVTEGSGDTTKYSYDNNGNVSSLQVTAGTTTATTGYNFDSLNHLVSLSQNSTTQSSYVYDERGNVILVTRGDGTSTSLKYDVANHVVSLRNYNPSGSLLETYAYTYDKNGNETSVVTNTGTISYTYDALNQLTKEVLVDGTTISYAYDKAGNRTSKSVTKSGTTTTTTYTYDAADELTAVNGQSYTYDANGNLTSNGSKTYVYDIANHLTQVKDSTGATLASFTYNGNGERSTMTTASGTITYHYNQKNQVVFETDENNIIVASYAWDGLNSAPVTMTKNGTTYYYHTDGNGNVTSLTDPSGNIVAQYQYDAYGNITSQTGSMAASNPYRYDGYRFDDATGLYFLNSRYYDPNVGRFITRDSNLGTTSDPLTLNKYAYVKNNPVNNYDPTGEVWYTKAWYRWQLLQIAEGGVFSTFFVAAYLLAHACQDNAPDVYRFATPNESYSSLPLCIQEIENSTEFRTTYRNAIYYAKKGSPINFTWSLAFTSNRDLKYAFHNMWINIQGTVGQKLKVSMWDVYDFDESQYLDGFTNTLNNIGWNAQQAGAISKFMTHIRFYF